MCILSCNLQQISGGNDRRQMVGPKLLWTNYWIWLLLSLIIETGQRRRTSLSNINTMPNFWPQHWWSLYMETCEAGLGQRHTRAPAHKRLSLNQYAFSKMDSHWKNDHPHLGRKVGSVPKLLLAKVMEDWRGLSSPYDSSWTSQHNIPRALGHLW